LADSDMALLEYEARASGLLIPAAARATRSFQPWRTLLTLTLRGRYCARTNNVYLSCRHGASDFPEGG
jgi:hypothetical protein